MLETVDLDASLSKEEFKKAHDPLDIRLAELQRTVRAAGIPVVVVFEGWEAAGVGTAISRLLAPLDPRGHKVHTFQAPTETESLFPPMWRYWLTLPARGLIAVYDGSWYWEALKRDKAAGPEVYERLRTFERQLADDGVVLLKFWLHISRAEQAKRFKKMKDDPALGWKISKEDWRRHRKYKSYCQVVEAALRETSTAYAPWTLVPAHDWHYACLTINETFEHALETAIQRKPQTVSVVPARLPRRVSPLDKVDLNAAVNRVEYDQELPRLQKELLRLEHLIYPKRIPVAVVYEGWDASGKGGNIKRLVAGLDHRGFEVDPFAAPEGDEKTHHYLWRFWRHVPKGGHITIFDRSWYGRVMVERIEGFATPEAWGRAYREINEFEQELTSSGIVLVKFWIHISKDEQLKRFRLREKTPFKLWKITDEDWRNRKQWDAYHAAVTEMIEKTSTVNAPWTIIEGNDKLHARLKALKTVAAAVERALKRKNGKEQ